MQYNLQPEHLLLAQLCIKPKRKDKLIGDRQQHSIKIITLSIELKQLKTS